MAMHMIAIPTSGPYSSLIQVTADYTSYKAQLQQLTVDLHRLQQITQATSRNYTNYSKDTHVTAAYTSYKPQLQQVTVDLLHMLQQVT